MRDYVGCARNHAINGEYGGASTFIAVVLLIRETAQQPLEGPPPAVATEDEARQLATG